MCQVQELQHEDIVIRRKAVVAARELLCKPEKYIQCIAAGVTPALIALLKVSAAGDRLSVPCGCCKHIKRTTGSILSTRTPCKLGPACSGI